MTNVPFWLVWCENGGEPRVKHKTPHQAEAEAERFGQSKPRQVILCDGLRIKIH